MSSQQEKQQRNPQDEFPELGSRKTKPSSREEKENKIDENRRSNKSPNQRSQQQTHQEGGHRSQGDRYDSNRTFNDIFDGNRQQIDGPQNYEMNRSHDGNRSQNYDGGRSQNDRFDGNRTKFFDNVRQNDRYENRQQNDHYDGNRSNNRYDNRYSNDQNERNQNDRYDNKYDNKRSSDKFDGNRLQNDRYDQRMERGGDKERNWDRRGGKMNDNRSGGFRTKNTIEFKNQNRNKPFDNVNSTSQIQSGSKGFASSGFNQRQSQNTEYEPDMPVESLSFTNSKLATAPQSMSERYPSLEYSQIDSRHRSVSEIDRPERPITGRQLGSSSSRSSNQMQQSSLPIVNPIHNQQPSMNIQQQISQPIQQQPQLLPQQQQNTNLMTTESRSAKRYSTLRQRTSEAVQTLSIPQHSLHDLHEQQQMLLQDAALMLQMQQSQEQIQLQPNLAHQPPSTNYTTQPIPMQLQNDYAALGPKSQTSGSAQSNQQPLIQTPTQNQSSSQSAQYPSAYFTSNEFAAQSSTAIQPAAQPSQLMNSQQYPAQYPQPTAAPYVQPPPQTSYIQPAVNQQQQLLNYVPSIPPAQQQFSTVQSFSTYPTVPNYNSVPV